MLLTKLLTSRSALLSWRNNKRQVREPGTIALFVALALVVPLIGLTSIVMYGPKIESDAFASLEIVVRDKAVQVKNWLDERHGNATALMTSPGFALQVERLIKQPHHADLANPILDYLNAVHSAYDYDGMLLLDNQGQTLLKVGAHTDPPETSIAQQAIKSATIQRSDLYRGQDGEVYLDWVMPVVVEGYAASFRRVIATVVLRSNAQRHLFPLVESWPTATLGAQSWLIRKQGDAVLLLNNIAHRPGTAMTQRIPLVNSEQPAVTAIQKASPGITQGNDLLGVPVLAAFHQVMGTDWHIIVKINRDDVLAPVITLVYWIACIAFIAIVILAAAIYVAVFSDISKLKATEAKLEMLAHKDILTNLPNRRLLYVRMQRSIEEAKGSKQQFALLMLDLDGFKNVNDSFGHPAGDLLLKQVAERLLARVRSTDIVARLGGDEFTVIMENINQPEDAAILADQIIADLSEPWQLLQHGEVRTGVSVGISLYPQHGDSSETLMQQADSALYVAKSNGRGCHAYYSDELAREARKRIELEDRLRKAIENNELEIHYQPQVNIAMNCIVGAEALVRWRTDEEGLVAPHRFIPIAEENGMIIAIGEWVLREVCRQGRAWLDAGYQPLTLAVNVSPVQIAHSNIGKMIGTVLEETNYPAQLLELELTESGLITNRGLTVGLFKELRALGVRLAIDDFGTGYSSLAYLKHFPLNVLKIDKSFIDDIPRRKPDMQIVATIIAIGRTLGFKVLAEGVETEEQLKFLREEGCDLYQGYLQSKPVPADEFVMTLRRMGVYT
jgi:diguanylate cyclase (GGDEF)-like protein